MKKLLIMTGVAAFALGAFAELPNGSDFDSRPTGVAFDSSDPSDPYWSAQGELDATVKKYDDGEALGVRPAVFSGDNANYLWIESAPTATNLVRNVDSAAVAIGNGLYLDTLVKFTVSTETMGVDDSKIGENERPAKLAIWAQETPAGTNFVVQAGYITAGGVVSTNYVMTAPANFDFSAWHRLTVKAIGDIGGGYVGFVVFVDGDGNGNGTALTRANSAAIGEEGRVPGLNTVADKFAAAVLPSMVNTGNTKTTLQAVSFSGNGGIDDVSFTDVAPAFAADDTVYTVTWDAGIESVSYNNTALVKDVEYTLPEEDPFDLVVTLKSGYELDEHTASTAGCTVALKEGADNTYTVTGAQAGTAITFTSFQPKASVVVDGKTTNYNTLQEAFGAIKSTGGTITLKADMTVGGEDVIVPEESAITVTIDLAGKKVTGSKEAAVFTAAGGTLVITDSVGGGEVVAGEDGFAVMLAGGKVTVYGGKFTGSFEVDEGIELIGSLELYGGSYDTETWVTKDDFKGIAKADVTGPDNDYFTVGGETPPEPTTYTVTFVDYDGTEIESGAVEEGVTPTAPAEDPTRTGYTFTGWYPTIEAVTSNTTYTATYSINTYTVTFDVDGDTTVITAQNVDYGNTATEPTAPTKDNYTFAGWTLAGQPYDFAAQVTDNITLVATWTAVVPPTPSVDPVDPAKGGTAEFDDEKAAAAAASAINDSKSTYITAPEGIADTYYANVEAKANGTTVSVVFTAAGEAAAQNSADTEVDELDKVLSAAAVDATAATITGAVPGFFYSVVYGTSLTGESAFADEGDRAQADKDGNVTIPVPTAGKGAGFYKVKVSPTK